MRASVMDSVDSIEQSKYERNGSNRSSKQAQSLHAAKASKLEDELRISLKSIEDLDMLRKRNSKLSDKVRKEKLHREALETFVEAQNKKIGILVDHVEKLMKALKIESSKSMKASDTNRKITKEKNSLLQKIEKQDKVIATQNRYFH